MRYNNAINNTIRRRYVYLKMSAAAKPPCGLGPVQEQLWNARRFFFFFNLRMSRKTWHFLCNGFKSCQVMCGQRSLKSEVQLWMI